MMQPANPPADCTVNWYEVSSMVTFSLSPISKAVEGLMVSASPENKNVAQINIVLWSRCHGYFSLDS